MSGMAFRMGLLLGRHTQGESKALKDVKGEKGWGRCCLRTGENPFDRSLGGYLRRRLKWTKANAVEALARERYPQLPRETYGFDRRRQTPGARSALRSEPMRPLPQGSETEFPDRSWRFPCRHTTKRRAHAGLVPVIRAGAATGCEARATRNRCMPDSDREDRTRYRGI